MNTDAETAIAITRRFNAPVDRVFRAWTDPDLLRTWLSAATTADARVGSRFQLTAGGAGEHVVRGEYLEVVPNRRLVMTWVYEGPLAPRGRIDSLLTVDFRPEGASSVLTLRHERLPASPYRDGLHEAWAQALEEIESALRATPPGAPVVLRLTRRFDAPAERVFDAWLDPEKARLFLFTADPAQPLVRAEIDPRVGGTFLLVDRRGDGDAEHTGEFIEIDRPRRLVFTFQGQSRVTIEIEPLEHGSELTLTHEMGGEWADFAGRVEEGWTGILEGLATVLD